MSNSTPPYSSLAPCPCGATPWLMTKHTGYSKIPYEVIACDCGMEWFPKFRDFTVPIAVEWNLFRSTSRPLVAQDIEHSRK